VLPRASLGGLLLLGGMNPQNQEIFLGDFLELLGHESLDDDAQLVFGRLNVTVPPKVGHRSQLSETNSYFVFWRKAGKVLACS
jgi:hypothetical protein